MAKPKAIQIEICVDSVESAQAAEAGGANRVELCQNLFEGGTTPSAGLIRMVKSTVRIPVFVILRPRGADFCYSEAEFRVMCEDLKLAKELGADGIVTGILRPDGTVDRRRMQELVRLAGSLPMTFHRAFDVTRDPFEALETLIDLNITRVLTSGQERSVVEGLDVLVELVRRAKRRIIVVPGGGLTERNFEKIRKQSRASEFHLSASAPVESRMKYRNPRVPMGRELRPPEFAWSSASEDRVRRLATLAHGGGRGD